MLRPSEKAVADALARRPGAENAEIGRECNLSTWTVSRIRHRPGVEQEIRRQRDAVPEREKHLRDAFELSIATLSTIARTGKTERLRFQAAATLARALAHCGIVPLPAEPEATAEAKRTQMLSALGWGKTKN